MINCLKEKLEALIGQPVKIYTDDGRNYKGYVVSVCEDTVEIIDKCGKLFLIELSRIVSVNEPQMDTPYCKGDRNDDLDFDNDFDSDYNNDNECKNCNC